MQVLATSFCFLRDDHPDYGWWRYPWARGLTGGARQAIANICGAHPDVPIHVRLLALASLMLSAKQCSHKSNTGCYATSMKGSRKFGRTPSSRL